MFLFTLVMPETLAPVLLKKEAAKLRKETGDPMYRTIKELEKKAFNEVVVIALLRPSIMLFTEPIIICMTLCMCFATLVLTRGRSLTQRVD
jgi:hypothetical protein